MLSAILSYGLLGVMALAIILLIFWVSEILLSIEVKFYDKDVPYLDRLYDARWHLTIGAISAMVILYLL